MFARSKVVCLNGFLSHGGREAEGFEKNGASNTVIMIDTGRLDYSSFFAFIVRLSALPFLESTFSIASGFIRDYFLVFIRFALR